MDENGLGTLDLCVLAAYLAGVFFLSWGIAGRQRNGTDYFLAGRRMGAGLLALSVLTNQVSAVSLVGAPAFAEQRFGWNMRRALAVFVLGALVPGAGERACLAGMCAGLAGNLALARLTPEVSWLWWNPAGFLVALGTALALSRSPFRWTGLAWPMKEARLLVSAFLLMLFLLAVF